MSGGRAGQDRYRRRCHVGLVLGIIGMVALPLAILYAVWSIHAYGPRADDPYALYFFIPLLVGIILSALLEVLALWLSVSGVRHTSSREDGRARRMGIAGLIMGILSLLTTLVVLVLIAREVLTRFV